MTDRTAESTSTPEAKSARAKTPLRRPHDTLSTSALVLSFAAVVYASGPVALNTPTGWTNHAALVACVIAFMGAVAYFSRAHGFSSRALRHAHWGIRSSLIAAYLMVVLLVSPALFESYGGERLLTLAMSCLGIAIFAVVPLKAALGRAPERTRSLPTDQGSFG